MAACLGLGLGTALAAELTITPAPAVSGPVTDDAYASTGWRYFDPGFLVDHLPFKLTIAQSISYTDNVASLPSNFNFLAGGAGITRLPSRGDFYSDTTLAVASRFPMGAQTFFFNGTYAPRRYFTDTAINADNYAVNGGLDYVLGDRCTGRLIGGVDHHQTPLFETVGAGLQDVTETSFNETARCKVTGHIAGLFNSGVSRIENTGGEFLLATPFNFGLNNYNQYYAGGGLEYAIGALDTLRGLITYTHRDFTSRSVGFGLASETDQVDYQAVYSRVFSAKLDGSASGGLTTLTLPGSPGTTQPTYSLQLNYRPTPKIVASGSISRAAGAPQSAISNFQVSDNQSLQLNYLYSQKLSFTGIYGHSTSRNSGGLAGLRNGALLFANVETDTASVSVNYRATPLLTATAAYSYVDRYDTSRSNFDAVSNVFRVGLVYTR